jgi:hypothetical protein
VGIPWRLVQPHLHICSDAQRGSADEEAEVEGMAGLAKSNGSSATRKAIDEAHVAQQVIHDQD